MTNWPNKTRPNKHAKIPHAYKASEEDPLILVPDEDIVPFFEQAMDHLDQGFGSRKVAEWLTGKIGKPISHQGIMLIWKAHRSHESQRIKDLNKANRQRKPKTAEEKRLAAAKQKKATARRVLTMQEKKLAELQPKEEPTTQASDALDFNVVEQKKQDRRAHV